MRLGLQLYTLRELLPADPAGVLRAVREAGFDDVEAASTAGIAELRARCDAAGLGLRDAFYGWTAVTGNHDSLAAAFGPEAVPRQTFPEMVDAAAAAGCEAMVFGYLLPGERATADDYRRRADEINVAAERVRAAGMRHRYHHHSFEFRPLPGEGGARGWDLLRERLDPALTTFEVDVFWARLGGEDPVALLDALGRRVGAIHLKDFPADAATEYDEHAVAPEAFLPVGAGALDVDGVLAAARRCGVERLVVEQDFSPDPLRDIAASAEVLRGR